MLPQHRPLLRRDNLFSSPQWLAPSYPFTAHGWTVKAAICSPHSINGGQQARHHFSRSLTARKLTRLAQLLSVLFRVCDQNRFKRTLGAPTGAAADAESPAEARDARGGGVAGGNTSIEPLRPPCSYFVAVRSGVPDSCVEEQLRRETGEQQCLATRDM